MRSSELVYRALRSRRGDLLPPVRWAKDLILFVNEMLGRPLTPGGEPARGPTSTPPAAPPAAEAPVVIYAEPGSRREVGRIVSVLEQRSIPYVECFVNGDPDMHHWLRSRSRRYELPLVFIGDRPVGGYHELVRLDVSGRLARMCQRA